MLGQYAAVIFDLDGTLLDTSEGILAATRHTLAHYGHEIPSDGVLRTFIGPPVQEGFARHLGLDEEESFRMAATFRAYYKERALFLARPYEGIGEVLDTLRDRGIRLCVATYKREDYAARLLEQFGLAQRFDVIHGADMAGRRDKTDIIRLCLEELDLANYRLAVMVGDSVHDARGAAEVGVDFVGVTYGFGFESADEVMRAGAIGAAATPPALLEEARVR